MNEWWLTWNVIDDFYVILKKNHHQLWNKRIDTEHYHHHHWFTRHWKHIDAHQRATIISFPDKKFYVQVFLNINVFNEIIFNCCQDRQLKWKFWFDCDLSNEMWYDWWIVTHYIVHFRFHSWKKKSICIYLFVERG